MQDIFLCQRFECLINLVQIQASLVCYISLIDVGIVNKQITIIAQQGSNDCVFLLLCFIQSVQFVSVQQKFYTGTCIWIAFIFNISGTHENLQGRIHLNREELIGEAEFLNRKFKGAVSTTANAHLIVVGKTLVHLLDICLFRIRVVDAFLQLVFVAVVVKQYGKGFFPVASRSSCFLEVCFDTAGTIQMDDDSYIGFVDTHSESVGSHDDAHLILLPGCLPLTLHLWVESCVEKGGT